MKAILALFLTFTPTHVIAEDASRLRVWHRASDREEVLAATDSQVAIHQRDQAFSAAGLRSAVKKMDELEKNTLYLRARAGKKLTRLYPNLPAKNLHLLEKVSLE